MSGSQVGVLGSGTTSRRNVLANLNNPVKMVDVATVYAPGDEADLTDSVRYVVDWALGVASIGVVLLVTNTDNISHLDDFVAEGAAIARTADPVGQIIKTSDVVLLAWDDTVADEYENNVVLPVQSRGAKCLDLVNGLCPLETDLVAEPAAVEAPEEVVATEPEASEVVVKPKATRTRSKRHDVTTPEAADEAQAMLASEIAYAASSRASNEQLGAAVRVLIGEFAAALRDQAVAA